MKKFCILLLSIFISTSALADIKTVGVIGTNYAKISKSFQKRADELGAILAKNKKQVFYSGDSTGLVGAMLNGAMRFNGDVNALSTEDNFDKNCPATHACQNTKTDFVAGNLERQAKLFDKSDALIIMPDGIKALSDVTSYFDAVKEGRATYKPIIFFDMNNYWFRTMQQFQEMVRQNLMDEKIFNTMAFINKPNDILPKAKRIQQEINRNGLNK